jgi:predicted amidohydrolase YtcJ
MMEPFATSSGMVTETSTEPVVREPSRESSQALSVNNAIRMYSKIVCLICFIV